MRVDRAHFTFGGEASDRVRNLGWERARPRLQNLFYQLKHLADCNGAIRAHEAQTGVRYAYKVRLRPDQAWQRDVPPLPSLNLSRSEVLFASRAIGKATEDMFAVGRAEPMDVLLDRFPFIHNFTRSASPFHRKHISSGWGRHGTGWTSEEFLFLHLRAHNVTLRPHAGFRCFIVRPANFSKGVQVT